MAVITDESGVEWIRRLGLLFRYTERCHSE